MAGAGLAITLAYLNLKRFRYREKIREDARARLDILSSSREFLSLQHLRQFKMIRELAGLRDNSLIGDDHERPTRPKLGKKPFWRNMPGLSRIAYNLFFSWHFDLWFCRAAALYSALMLWFGVKHSAKLQFPPVEWFAGDNIQPWLFGLVACVFVPMFFVTTGNLLVYVLRLNAREAADELADVMVGFADQAQLGDPPEPAAENPGNG